MSLCLSAAAAAVTDGLLLSLSLSRLLVAGSTAPVSSLIACSLSLLPLGSPLRPSTCGVSVVASPSPSLPQPLSCSRSRRMHTMEVGTANVPAFLTKLWKLVEDPAYADLISWSSSGRSFLIRNPARFAKELLPLYFKHNNMASFIRQLNMYGFRKLTSIENSGLRSERDEMEFYHQYFLKQQENLLEYIKRKASPSSAAAAAHHHSTVSNGSRDQGVKVEEVHELLTSIMQRQDSHESFRVSIQNEYSSLWKEITYLRQQNAKQQTIVQRLIQFLMSLVQNQRNVSPSKRKETLMIDGVDASSTQPAKRLNLEPGTIASSSGGSSSGSGSGYCSSSSGSNQCHERTSRSETAIKTGIMEAISSGLSGGPVIHDVTDDVIEAELEAAANSNPIVSNSNGELDHQEPPAHLFQDIDLDILNQVLEITGAVTSGAGQDASDDCSRDGHETFPLDSAHLLPLASSNALPASASAAVAAAAARRLPSSQPALVNGLMSGLLEADPPAKLLPAASPPRAEQQRQQQQRQHQETNYWPTYESIARPVVHSPDPVDRTVTVLESPEYHLVTNSLLDDKEADLVMIPGVAGVLNSSTGEAGAVVAAALSPYEVTRSD